MDFTFSINIRKIIRLIEQDSYFTINRARQYGRTTTLVALWKQLKEQYIVISTSFEGLGNDAFRTEDAFVRRFCTRIASSLKLSGYGDELQELWNTGFGEENRRLYPGN